MKTVVLFFVFDLIFFAASPKEMRDAAETARLLPGSGYVFYLKTVRQEMCNAKR